MKIGICTINDNNNYGNRLQNYALQELLKEKGYSPETIVNNTSHIKGNKISVEHFFPRFVKKIKGRLNRRNNCFRKFNKLITFYKDMIDDEHISKGVDEYFDCFFTGSDQVWNPTFSRFSPIDFLTFANKRKRNSFSASIGIDDIPDNFREDFAMYFSEMNHISVREESAKTIIEDLTKRTDVEVLLDPTMLVKSSTWEKVINKPAQFDKNVKGNYILVYFLGKMSRSINKEIERVASENGCKIINLLDENNPFYQTGPSEFLWLEKNAFLVCTDSFHSAIFAILFDKPFIVFERDDSYKKMNTRLKNLLTKLQLEKCEFNGMKITENNMKCDYTEVYKIIENERKKADVFLNNVLAMK